MARKLVKALKKPTAESREPTAESRKPNSLKILMIASEAQPFSKTGGLADVATALPKALGRLGHDVTLITPRYRGIADGPIVDRLSLELAGHHFRANLIEARLDGAWPAEADGRKRPRVLLLDCPELYDRSGIYYDARGDYADNAVRFAFLSAAAIDWVSAKDDPFDIIHSHDWQGGLAAAYARRLRQAPKHSGTAAPRHPDTQTPRHPSTVFTIHNLAYQGIFDKTWVPHLGLTWQDFTINGFEFFDRLSFMKAGINLSDAITTVSPTYAEEIQRPEYGSGLDGVIRSRRESLVGILNGIDPDEWNPLTDQFLPAPFDADSLDGKAAAKRALLETFGFTITEELLARPVIGMVSRMVDQKGLDLIASVAGELAALNATFVIVGTGEPRYQDMWTNLSRWRPDRIRVFVGFDERRAHLVEGGADIFLMPSRFEPCGLNQMYSLRYGTVPVVRAVGGLVDTVRPFNPRNGHGTGFLFADYHPAALMEALHAALATYPNAKAWRRLQKNGMRADFSWDRSAGEYVKMYQRLRPRKALKAPTRARNASSAAASKKQR